MKLLHRFLLRHFLRILLLCMGAFIGIYLLIDFFEKIGDFISHQATPGDVLSYLINSIPIIVVQVLPLAILMTVVLTLSGLGRTNEVTAMRACGISLWRIVQPFMVLSLFLSFLLLGMNEYIVPHNARALNQLLEVKLKGKHPNPLTRNEVWYRQGNRMINVKLAVPKQQELHGISIYVLEKSSRLRQRLDANKAVFEQSNWQAEELLIRDFDPQNGSLQQTRTLLDQPLDLGRSPDDFATQELRNDEFSAQQLAELVDRLETEGLSATRQRVDLQTRLASPFTCLIMGFLGVPFALQKGRRGNIALGIGLSLGIGIVYFILFSLVTAFGYSGALPPIVAAWAANFIFLLLGIWLLLSAKE